MKRLLLFSTCMMVAVFLYSQSLSPEVVSASGDYFEAANGSLSWTLGEVATETFENGNMILTQGFQQTFPESGFSLSLKVWLEGPFTGSVMGTNLNGLPDFPMNQPYSGPPWNYPGTESIASIPNPDIVDWILVELRDAPDAASAGSSTTIGKQAAFLLSNATVTGMDGYNPPTFSLTVASNLYVVIRHRNHLGVLSNFPLTYSNGVYSYDFSAGEMQVYGGALGHKQIATGIWGLAGGDGDALGQINNGDKNEVWSPQAGSSGYLAGDFSMDSQVNNLDKNDIWVPNSGKGTQVPDFAKACATAEAEGDTRSSGMPDNIPSGGFKCMVPE